MASEDKVAVADRSVDDSATWAVRRALEDVPVAGLTSAEEVGTEDDKTDDPNTPEEVPPVPPVPPSWAKSAAVCS